MRMRTMTLAISLIVAFGLLASASVQAAQVTKVFRLNGGNELWNWTTTGVTKLGTPVNSSTMPREMADPAKLSWYNAAGEIQFEYRNYRPGEYVSLNNWKTGTSAALVAFNLAGKASGSSVLYWWGEASTINVTSILQPTAYPGYDNVGTNWFAQVDYRSELGADAPTWWCESQANAILKNLTRMFTDEVEYTFDDSAIRPDNTVALWIGGFVTTDLAGMEAGTAEYGVLEGAASLLAYTDLDGDGYFPEEPTSSNLYDCCDDPSGPCLNPAYQTGRGSADPPICATCVCGNAECAPCARCIHKGTPAAWEFANDLIDTNCNNNDNCFIATASFGTSLEGKIEALRMLRDRYLVTNRIGRAVVDKYYAYSPPIADSVRAHEGVRLVVRGFLLPAVGASWILSSPRTAVFAICVGISLLGVGIMRRKGMKRTVLPLLLAALVGLPVTASATLQDDIAAGKPVETIIAQAITSEGMTITQVVEHLIQAGLPANEVIKAALKLAPSSSAADIIKSAIAAGADPFVVAYAAKASGIQLQEVVVALEGVRSESGTGTKGFVPPEPVLMTPAYVVTGTGSSWGRSHYVASPSL